MKHLTLRHCYHITKQEGFMKHILVLLTTMLLITGCSGYTLLNSETYDNADMSDYEKYRIVSRSKGQLPPGMQPVTYSNIVASIRDQMLKRGYIESPDATLLINIGVTIHHTITPEDAAESTRPGHKKPAGPYYNGYYPFFVMPRDSYWNDCETYTRIVKGLYEEGVLTIDMIDTRKMKPLYSSSVATIINPVDGSYRDLPAISEAVSVMFSQYPVPLLEAYRPKKN